MSQAQNARQHMIDSQLRPNEVNDEKIIEAISSVRRERFVPKSLGGVAYHDDNIQVAPGRYMMGPMIFARLLVMAQVKESDLVLDVGCGTGYSTAVLGRLAEAVVALEEDENLAEMATKILATEACENVAVVTGPLRDGLAGQGPYDLIFINGMIDTLPNTLVDQIAPAGRLVCVLNQSGIGQSGIGKAVYVTNEHGVASRRILFDATIPAFESFSQKKKFSF